MFTVGPVAENTLPLPPRRLRPRADRRPGRRGRQAARRDRRARRDARRDPAHPHALRPRRRGGAGGEGDRRRGVGARDREAGARRHQTLRALAGLRPVRVLRRRAHAHAAASSSSWPGFEIDVLFTPGHSPGHVTFSIPDEQAIFSGDVLFQGSVGRTDLPGGDWATLLESIRALVDALPAETAVLPRPHGHHDASAPSARATRSWPSWPASRWPRSSRPRGARSTCCPRTRAAAWTCSATARRAARPRGLRAVRDAGLRGHRAVRPRGGRVHRHRPEGDVHLRGQGRPLAHAAPRGHRRRLPRLRRARHAQAARSR